MTAQRLSCCVYRPQGQCLLVTFRRVTIDWVLDSLAGLSSQHRALYTSSFVSPLCSKSPFCMDANWQGSLCSLLAQPSLQPLSLWVTLLDWGSGRQAVLLLEKVSLCSGLSFLYSSPSMRWDLPQEIRWSVPPPSPSP